MYLPELDIYSSLDRVVELTQEYPIETDVEVYSPMKLTIQYLALDSEDKLQSEIYFQYFEKISQSLLSTSEYVVKVNNRFLQVYFDGILYQLKFLSNCRWHWPTCVRIPNYSL